MINEFIAGFTDQKIEGVKRIGRRHYLAQKELQDALKPGITPESLGIFLGEDRRDSFSPSLALLDMLSKMSNKKTYVDDKSAWLFLCGRDIMSGSITKANVSSGLTLVQNEKDENLGYGKIVWKINDRNPDKIVIKNILDKGDYLRREMDH